MALNLHSAVRGVIPAVNPDTSAWWYQSIGVVIGSDGAQSPAFSQPVAVKCNVQPPSGKDLRHIEYLQMQGVIRSVYMYSDPQGIVRVNAQGGDLLLFPQFIGQPNDVWLVARSDETWSVGNQGWSKVYAVLQTDRMYSQFNTQGQLVLDSEGRIVP